MSVYYRPWPVPLQPSSQTGVIIDGPPFQVPECAAWARDISRQMRSRKRARHEPRKRCPYDFGSGREKARSSAPAIRSPQRESTPRDHGPTMAAHWPVPAFPAMLEPPAPQSQVVGMPQQTLQNPWTHGYETMAQGMAGSDPAIGLQAEPATPRSTSMQTIPGNGQRLQHGVQQGIVHEYRVYSIFHQPRKLRGQVGKMLRLQGSPPRPGFMIFPGWHEHDEQAQRKPLFRRSLEPTVPGIQAKLQEARANSSGNDSPHVHTRHSAQHRESGIRGSVSPNTVMDARGTVQTHHEYHLDGQCTQPAQLGIAQQAGVGVDDNAGKTQMGGIIQYIPDRGVVERLSSREVQHGLSTRQLLQERTHLSIRQLRVHVSRRQHETALTPHVAAARELDIHQERLHLAGLPGRTSLAIVLKAASLRASILCSTWSSRGRPKKGFPSAAAWR